VRVGVERLARGCVTESRLHNLDALAVPDQQAGVVVPKLVEAGPGGRICGLDNSSPYVPERRAPDRIAGIGDEHQTGERRTAADCHELPVDVHNPAQEVNPIRRQADVGWPERWHWAIAEHRVCMPTQLPLYAVLSTRMVHLTAAPLLGVMPERSTTGRRVNVLPGDNCRGLLV